LPEASSDWPTASAELGQRAWSCWPRRVSGTDAGAFGIATHVVPAAELKGVTAELAQSLAAGPTLAYAALRSLLKAWAIGGVSAADASLPDLAIALYASADTQNGLAAVCRAYDEKTGFPTLTFAGR
jgi:enoyl-CoA hydratase/carnithine racemase